MQVGKVIGPASFASALINGDQSGLTTEDVIALNKWIKRELEDGESVVSCDDEPYFSNSYGLYDDRYRAGDLLEYQTLKP